MGEDEEMGLTCGARSEVAKIMIVGYYFGGSHMPRQRKPPSKPLYTVEGGFLNGFEHIRAHNVWFWTSGGFFKTRTQLEGGKMDFTLLFIHLRYL